MWRKAWLAGSLPAIALHALTSPGGVTLRAAFEAALLGALLAWVAPRLAPLAAEIPKRVRAALGVLVAMQIFAQIADRPLLTYPAAQWGMYGYVPPRDVEVWTPIGITSQGDRVELRASSAFPPLDAQRLSFRIADLADEPRFAPCLDETLRAIGRREEVREVELVERRFRADRWEESDGEVVRKVEVGP